MIKSMINRFLVFGLCCCFYSCNVSKHQGNKANSQFISIFDGKTLNSWKGDPKYWSVENGNLVGTVTPETILKRNTFIIWQGAQPEDFELKLEYRISEEGNSGVNYRSSLIDTIPFALRGYQCDIDGKKRFTGQNYEERKRTTLAYQGENVIINTQINPDIKGGIRTNVKKNCWQTREVIDTLGTTDFLKSKIKDTDWNKVHLIVKGNKLEHYINGTLMSSVVDNDTLNRSNKGFIGVQVHVGPPMKVEYRNIELKEL
jgi:hypothetical protein